MERWLKRLMDKYQSGKLVPIPKGGICHILVAHDDNCPKVAGKGPCNCEAEVRSMNKTDFN